MERALCIPSMLQDFRAQMMMTWEVMRMRKIVSDNSLLLSITKVRDVGCPCSNVGVQFQFVQHHLLNKLLSFSEHV